jgi:hypothetical protein
MNRYHVASALLLAACLTAAPAAAQIRVPRAVNRALSGPSPEIQRLLARIDSTRARFDRATALLVTSSLVMEGVVSTADRKAEIRRELASANEREQRGGDNRVELDAEDHATRLEAATQQRQFEHQQLSQEQSANVSAAAFNSALAALLDAMALNDARQLIGETQSAASAMGSDPANAVFAGRLTNAATQQLPAIVNAVPTQVRLATAIKAAARQAGAANRAVSVSEATAATDPPRRIDPNAI